MFKQLQQLDTAFRYVRGFTLLIIASCMGLSAWVVWSAQQTSRQLQDKIYILSNEKALEAVAETRQSNLPVEARDHVRSFHEAFFRLDPDEKVIQQTIAKALYLADESAKQQYDNLKEQGFYRQLIAGNISQHIAIDSVLVQTEIPPYYFRCYASQQIIRTSSVLYRKLITDGYLRLVRRSDHNPHGFLIERWRILENPDIRRSAR
nr:conjugative transposon protein TraK [Flavihumibacter cheonanensis]